jgi:hypothetical protein
VKGDDFVLLNLYHLKGSFILKLFFYQIRGFFLFSCLTLFLVNQAQAEKIPEVTGFERSPERSDLARQIKAVFADAPLMVQVAKCESGLVHRENGVLFQNSDGSSARGVFQVLMRVHKTQMHKMGLNPEHIDQYLTYVRHLYDQQGLKPWQASKHCWKEGQTHPHG